MKVTFTWRGKEYRVHTVTDKLKNPCEGCAIHISADFLCAEINQAATKAGAHRCVDVASGVCKVYQEVAPVEPLTPADYAALRWAVLEAEGWRGCMVGNPDPGPLEKFDKQVMKAHKALAKVRKASRR